MEENPRRRTALLVTQILVTVAAILVLIWATRFWSSETGPKVVSLYGFSVLDQVMEQGVLPAFAETWRRERGESVEFVAAFAGSGAVTDRILQKYPAEIVLLSSPLDALRLAATHLPASSWSELPHGGVFASSPIVILVRPGNPEAIRDFQDLARDGIEVVQADPTTSGAANWAILAQYGSALRRTGDPELAARQLVEIWNNTVVWAPSAKEARQRFADGEGNALVTYEQNALSHPPGGPIGGEVVYPPSTILCQHVAAPIAKNVDEAHLEVVAALVEFLWSREAQRLFAASGFRGADGELSPESPTLGVVEDLFTLDELGGAVAVRREILERIWKKRVLAELER